MKLYSVEALFGKQGTGFVFDCGDGVRLFGMPGVGGAFKAGVLWPDTDFSGAVALDGEARGGLMSRIVKSALSKRTEGEFAAAYAETLRFFTALGSSLECSWVQIHLLDRGVIYADEDGTRRTVAGNSLADSAVANAVMKKSGRELEGWREVHRANLRARGEECELHARMMSEGPDMLYPWTKEDAEDCAAFYTEGHWLADRGENP